MEQETANIQTGVVVNEEQLDMLLQGLWERVRRAGEFIHELRLRKTELTERVEALERDLSRLKAELSTRDDIIKTLTEQQNAGSQGKTFTNGERDAIAARVKELLVKLEGYL